MVYRSTSYINLLSFLFYAQGRDRTSDARIFGPALLPSELPVPAESTRVELVKDFSRQFSKLFPYH